VCVCPPPPVRPSMAAGMENEWMNVPAVIRCPCPSLFWNLVEFKESMDLFLRPHLFQLVFLQHFYVLTTKKKKYCTHWCWRLAAKIVSDSNNNIKLKDSFIKVILTVVLLSSVSSNVSPDGPNDILGHRPGSQINTSTQWIFFNELSAAAGTLWKELLCSAWAPVAPINRRITRQMFF